MGTEYGVAYSRSGATSRGFDCLFALPYYYYSIYICVPAFAAGETMVTHTHQPDEAVARLQAWADGQKAVRAMLLTSRRVVPHATVDR